jgi:uncharacterized protein (UPF0335 family)
LSSKTTSSDQINQLFKEIDRLENELKEKELEILKQKENINNYRI